MQLASSLVSCIQSTLTYVWNEPDKGSIPCTPNKQAKTNMAELGLGLHGERLSSMNGAVGLNPKAGKKNSANISTSPNILTLLGQGAPAFSPNLL